MDLSARMVQDNSTFIDLSMDSLVELAASLPEGQTQILARLHGIISECGGWVLSRGSTQPKLVRFLFEFPRDICVEIYSAMVSLGLDLSGHSHRVLAELCRCTPFMVDLPSRDILAADTHSLDEATKYLCSLEIIKVELYVQIVPREAGENDSSDAA